MTGTLSLQEFIRYTWENSTFYRRFWADRGFRPDIHFSGLEDLAKIPIVHKDDFLKVSPRTRSIIPKEEYLFTAVSSGTTQMPTVSFQRRSFVPPYYTFITKRCNYKSVLAIRHPTASFLTLGAVSGYFREGSILAEGDIFDLERSAEIARQIEMDHLATTPSTAIRFAHVLASSGYPPERVTFVAVSGEPLTTPLQALLRRLYPNALILATYGTSEAPTPLGYNSSYCRNLLAISANAYHLNTASAVFEVQNNSLVATVLHEAPLPLIRYELGDRAVILDGFRCTCGFPPGPVGIIGGRISEKNYKIGALVFRQEAVEKVLADLAPLIYRDFILELEQVADGDTIVVVPTLILRPRNTRAASFLSKGFLASLFADTLAAKIEDTLQVLPRNGTLAYAVGEGLAKPLVIKFDQFVSGAKILPPLELRRLFEYRNEKSEEDKKEVE